MRHRKESERYRYAGDHGYLQGKATEMIDPAPVLSMLGGKQAYRRFVQDGMSEGHREGLLCGGGSVPSESLYNDGSLPSSQS